MRSTCFALCTFLLTDSVLGRWTPQEFNVLSIDSTSISQGDQPSLEGAVPSGLTCHLKHATIDEQKLNDLTGYACTKVDCAPIKPGGKLYPCSSYDCANWAVNALFQKNYPTQDFVIDDACYSAGIAQASPRPNHFFVQALSSSLTNQDNDIQVTSNIAKIAPGKTHKYSAKNLTMSFDKVGKTFFQGLWVAAGEGSDCKVTASVSYDFEGDGKWDRVETFQSWGMAASPAYENYNSGTTAPPSVKGGYMQDLKGGTVQLALSGSDKCTVNFLQGATGGPPAGVTIPFGSSDDGENNAVKEAVKIVTSEAEVQSVPAGLTCHLKDAVIGEAQLGGLLGYACGKIDCAPIKPGGKEYPCSPYECANWAVNALFQANYPTVEYEIDTSCYAQGIAQASPRPNHFFVEALSSMLAAEDNDIKVTSNIATIAAGKTHTYSAKNLTMSFDKVGKTFFQGLWVAAGEGSDCKVTASVSYDFEGDGKWERVETYQSWGMAASPAYENYNSGTTAPPSVKGGYMQDLKGGTVQLALSGSDKCTVNFLQGATGGPPAGVTIPFGKASMEASFTDGCPTYTKLKTVFHDMHDGDQKIVSLNGSKMTIKPYGNNQTWVVHADMRSDCSASIQFNVPGKPNPPPVALKATLYTMTNPGSPSMSKPIIQFTDPSGTIAPKSVPLNAWIPDDK